MLEWCRCVAEIMGETAAIAALHAYRWRFISFDRVVSPQAISPTTTVCRWFRISFGRTDRDWIEISASQPCRRCRPTDQHSAPRKWFLAIYVKRLQSDRGGFKFNAIKNCKRIRRTGHWAQPPAFDAAVFPSFSVLSRLLSLAVNTANCFIIFVEFIPKRN